MFKGWGKINKQENGIAMHKPPVCIRNATSGITLVALIITIIVLLILVGVTISMVLGENGLIGRAQNAGEETRGTSVEEEAALWKADVEMTQYIGGTSETLPEILQRLETQNLLINNEIKEIMKEENTNREIKIGSKTISFKIDVVAGGNEKNPSTEIIGDGSYINGVNSPKLGSEMKAIVYDGSSSASGNIPANWKEAKNENEWYNYTNNQWANAVTKDGSMWAWIPRYEYQITGQTIDVKFIETSKTTASSGYIIHPTFEDGSSRGKDNNYMNGEWDKELSGIWVAKFEASRVDSTSSTQGSSTTIKIQPDTKSWVSITVGDSYTNSLNMYTGYNSHLMKNSEWGAIAYLTQSSYGRSGTEVTINNNTSIVTGGGDYITNTNQSSTENTSGIYDLNGGAWEKIAAYISNGDSSLKTCANSFANTSVNADGYKTLSTNYATVYPYNSSSDTNLNNWTVYSGLKTGTYGYGDAVLETSTAGSGSTSWNSDYSDFPYTGPPFFIRRWRPR